LPSIIKPSRISVSVLTEAIDGGALTTVTLFVLCDFQDPDRLLTEQALWPMVTEQLPKGAIFDKGQLKPFGELIVAGCALSPTEDPVEAVRVDVRFGSLMKSLAVFGDRRWMLTDRGIEMSRPQPFLKMPIGLQQAFGGPNYKANPAGKGHDAHQLLDAGFDAPLPNVELCDAAIRSVNETPRPAHFGPLAPDDPSRMRYVGTYDQLWLKTRAPLKPEDFNPLFHCDAPEDQRFENHFEGGEAFSVSGMSRGETLLSGTLPALRARCFYHLAETDELRETRMVCDTVTLFPNVRKATLAFRGLIKGQDRTGDDIGTIMAAMERKADPERAPEHYQEIFRKRTDPESGHLHLLSDFQLMPERNPEIVSAQRKARMEKAQADRIKFIVNADWGTRKAVENTGLSPDVIPPPDFTAMDDIPLVATPTKEEIANGEFDIAELIEQAEEARRAVEDKMNEQLAMAELQRRKLVDAVPDVFVPEAGRYPIVGDEVLNAYPDLELPDDMAASLDQIAPVMARARGEIAKGIETGGAPIPEDKQSLLDRAVRILDGEEGYVSQDVEDSFNKAKARALKLPEGSLLADVKHSFDTLDLSPIDQVEDLDQAIGDVLNDFGGLSVDVPQAPDPGKAASKPFDSANMLPSPDFDAAAAAQVAERIDGSKDRIRQIAGHIIPENSDDPIGDIARFSQENLAPPNAEEMAKLPPRKKAETLLSAGKDLLASAEEQLDDAIPEVRRLSPEPIFPMEALASGVSERLGAFVLEKLKQGHDFRGADLAGAVLRGADFGGMDLSGTMFEKADLTGANFSGSDLTNAVFAGANLEKADFSNSNLSSANLSKASMKQSNLSGATLLDLEVVETNFERANLSGIRMGRVQFMSCSLDNATMQDARLEDIQLVRCSGAKLSLNGAKVNGLIAIQTSLEQLNAEDADLDRLILADAALRGANFKRARLDNTAILGDSSIEGGSFHRLNAFNTFFNGLNLSESCFVGSSCKACYFHQCDLTSCDFRVSSLNATLFGGSTLTGSDFFGSSLFGASLDKCDLKNCSFRSSNLYAANLMDTALASADMTGANLGLTLLGQMNNG